LGLERLRKWREERDRLKYVDFLERKLLYDLQRTELQQLKRSIRRGQEVHRLQKQIHEKDHQKVYVV